jgi:hypothetical protein
LASQPGATLSHISDIATHPPTSTVRLPTELSAQHWVPSVR